MAGRKSKQKKPKLTGPTLMADFRRQRAITKSRKKARVINPEAAKDFPRTGTKRARIIMRKKKRKQ